MDEDKNLKELLEKWAVMDTPADFTNQVIQRIQSAYAIKPAAIPVLKHKLMKVLIGVFVLVCIILLALSVIAQPIELPVKFTVEVPPKYFSQIISFLIIFWLVMLANQWWNKKRTYA